VTGYAGLVVVVSSRSRATLTISVVRGVQFIDLQHALDLGEQARSGGSCPGDARALTMAASVACSNAASRPCRGAVFDAPPACAAKRTHIGDADVNNTQELRQHSFKITNPAPRTWRSPRIDPSGAAHPPAELCISRTRRG